MPAHAQQVVAVPGGARRRHPPSCRIRHGRGVSSCAGTYMPCTLTTSRTAYYNISVGIVSMIARAISLLMATRLKSMSPADGGVSLRVVSLVGSVGSFDLTGDLGHSTYNL